MLQVFLSYLILFGLNSNIMVSNGAGALQFGREKMYRSFRYLNALFLILGITIAGFLSYVLQTYLYPIVDFEFAHFSFMVIIVGLYNIVVMHIWKKASKFKYYLYETSYSYAFDFVFTLSAILMLDMSVSILYFVFEILAVIIVILLMNVIIGFFVRTCNRGYMNVNFRNVASRLFLLAIISILLYYGSLLAA